MRNQFKEDNRSDFIDSLEEAPDYVERVVEYRKEGLSYKKISEKPDIPVSDAQVKRWCYRFVENNDEISEQNLNYWRDRDEYPEYVQKSVRLRKEGYTYEEIAEEVDRSVRSIETYCREVLDDFEQYSHSSGPRYNVDLVAQLIEDGLTYSAIGEIVGCAPETITRWVREGSKDPNSPYQPIYEARINRPPETRSIQEWEQITKLSIEEIVGDEL